ncbi:MAG TPA: vWA domain-containing protein [Polyangiaceae bacterium]|nr:vWA domain-containing protein [Polyangiaceae bacterium]
MRVGQVGPLFFGVFIALACGSNVDESKVDGININTDNRAGSGTIEPGTGTGSANGSGGAGSGVDPNTACAQSSADGQPTQVDLYFMVDSTGSMNCPVPELTKCEMPDGPPATGESRWTVVSAALKAFVADAQNQGLGVGLRFFPVRGNSAACNAASYANPNVEIGPLSMTSQALTTAINRQMPDGSTPTVPSLTAAIDHASAWAKAHPTHRVAVVYATDGQPNGCGASNTVPQAAMVAARGVTAGIPTYVLGVGPDLANLNSIAMSGGTNTAFLVDTTQNAAAQLSAALASIRSTTALDCTYTIPPPPAGQTLVEGKVNVQYTNGAGVVTQVLQDPNNPPCASGSGWQYSADKKQINLCGKACTDAKADKGGKIQVLFGCDTVIGNPPK